MGVAASVGEAETVGDGVCALVSAGWITHRSNSVRTINLLRRFSIVVILILVRRWSTVMD
jgi:hypothetical protein